MKKISFLMALIVCLGCIALAACNEDELDAPETTGGTQAVTTTEAPESTADTDKSGNGGGSYGGGGETSDTTPVIGNIDPSKDAVADDIYGSSNS